MGPRQLAGVLSIVARAAAAERRATLRRGRRRRDAGGGRAADRGRVTAHVPVRPGLRRRHHRPARYPDRARPVPCRSSTARLAAGAAASASSGCDRGDDAHNPGAGRQPGRDRPPGRGDQSTGSGWKPSPCYSDADLGAPHVRRGRRGGPAARAAAARLTCGPTCSWTPRCGPGRTPSTRATASCPRTPGSLAPCTTAGLTWIGPSPDAIAAMGGKVESKRLCRRGGRAGAGRTRPGRGGRGDLPVLVKASAGGGGRGMRVVRGARRPASRDRRGPRRGGGRVR